MSSVKSAFEILFAFLDSSSERGELGVSELSRLTGQTKNQTFRLLQTMSSLGVVTQDPKHRTWALSYRLLELGSAAHSRLSLVDSARESLDTLHRELGDQILLGVLTGGFATIPVDVRRGIDIRPIGEIGSRFVLHAGGGSKLLLAFSPPEYIEEYLRVAAPLKRFTANTCVQPSLVREECARIRSQGYALSFQDLSLDRCSIAVPIRDRDGEVIAGISASSPVSRFGEEDRQRKLELLRKASADVTNRLGGFASQLNQLRPN
ncbi:MAG: IclR family transcriptional regulator [Thermomicrobiales bacterium]|nr:IclR family transcriptional regulator [Thermomicrobiales bacterium]